MNSRTHSPLAQRLGGLIVPLEIAVVLVCALLATRHLANLASNLQLAGDEFNHVIIGAALASKTLHHSGALPHWNPLMGNGEPLFESQFSFLLNPFLAIPVLAAGAAQGGKIGVILHVALLGLGGWTLAYVLRMGTAGRVLLGLLMAGSGSMASPLGWGFYQMGLSLAYVPWIFAGLYAALHTGSRRAVGLLVVATVMMIFSGILWFVLPAAVSALLVVAFNVWRRADDGRLVLDGARVRRLLWAAALVVGLSAVRLLIYLNSGMVFHEIYRPPSGYRFEEVMRAYFEPRAIPFASWWFGYHYVVPGWFAALVLAVRLLPWRRAPMLTLERLGILGPALCSILVFSVLAQENPPLVVWLYENTPLEQWRWPVRMAALASPWVAVLVAWGFDECIRLLATVRPRRIVFRDWVRGQSAIVPPRPFAYALLVMLCVLAGAAAEDVLRNWPRYTSLIPVDHSETLTRALIRLRLDHPGDMLPVRTEGFVPSLRFFDLLIRTSVGNPSVFTNGLPSTLGLPYSMRFGAEFSFAQTLAFQDVLLRDAYKPYPGSPAHPNAQRALWRRTLSPSYAFTIDYAAIANMQRPLLRSMTDTVTTYNHRIDTIEVWIDNRQPNQVLVIQETAYPGWQASIGGVPAPLESVDGRLAVVLPPPDPERLTVHVVLRFRSPLLAPGALVSGVWLLVFAAYLLRLDQRARVGLATARVFARNERVDHAALRH